MSDASVQKSPLSLAEEAMLATWAKENTFKKSVTGRKDAPLFSFYDGPPFANGLPHYGHLATSVLKDGVARYKTMRGYHVPRRFGWDCHGLPAEMLAEKELNVSGKKAIQKYGIDNFNQYCRESVMRFTSDWHDYVERLGRWVDFEDDYRTMDQDYMESVMWAFKQLYDKGLIYEGERVVPYSYGAQTALSNFETRADDSYRDREDITATVKFKLEDGRYILGWTTTPWTLPSNLLLAVGSDIDYVEVEDDGVKYILAEAALERYPELDDAEVVRRVKGNKLVGLSYAPLFDYFKDTHNAFRIVAADFVTTEDGTGVVHIAPGHGEDDYWLGKREGLPAISPVDDDGRFTNQVSDYAGRLVFDANNEIVADLEKSKKLFKSALFTHKYPHCWRTDVPIIYRAMSAWFVDVPKIKKDLLAANQNINWIPNNVKNGAVGKWLEGAREWNISRKRFWGSPIPVWKTEDGELIVPGSLAEIRKMAVDPNKVTDLHRPFIDEVVLKTADGRLAHRVEDVLDCWFESGSMPFAQMHYPFENKKRFEQGFPADFITEFIGQTRGWFYTLHVMQVALFGREAFKNCVAHGILLGEDGRKLSKRLKNYPDVNLAINKYGVDSLRVYMLGMSVMSGDTSAFDEKTLTEVQRNVIQRLRNVYSFFTMYADVDKWVPGKALAAPKSKNVLDEWMLARLQRAINETTQYADAYDMPKAMKVLADLLDDTSNWFVRRSRRRFWKSEDDGDKADAYATLHYTLVRLTQLLAPWAPFVTDELWRSLTKGMGLPKSVHLSDWPEIKELGKAQAKALDDMHQVREIITEGLSQRASAKVKVRQPLAKVTVPKVGGQFTDILAEELNVKKVAFKTGSVVLDTTLTDDLKAEGAMRDIVRHVQNLRKTSGLNVDDRIVLHLESADALMQRAVSEFGDVIAQETLAVELSGVPQEHAATAKIDGVEVSISLSKNK
ncbi:MAG TPA: isoleucine--tRNA ligase [Candidatus Saccharimonadales bacterium]|nr:isoleucine--tRNA ligase [Candidatus Saccharimonadales bacterium]